MLIFPKILVHFPQSCILREKRIVEFALLFFAVFQGFIPNKYLLKLKNLQEGPSLVLQRLFEEHLVFQKDAECVEWGYFEVNDIHVGLVAPRLRLRILLEPRAPLHKLV